MIWFDSDKVKHQVRYQNSKAKIRVVLVPSILISKHHNVIQYLTHPALKSSYLKMCELKIGEKYQI